MANSGWDSICSDAQHGLIGYETAVYMLQVISTAPVSPIIRVAWNEPGTTAEAAMDDERKAFKAEVGPRIGLESHVYVNPR